MRVCNPLKGSAAGSSSDFYKTTEFKFSTHNEHSSSSYKTKKGNYQNVCNIIHHLLYQHTCTWLELAVEIEPLTCKRMRTQSMRRMVRCEELKLAERKQDEEKEKEEGEEEKGKKR